MYSSEKSSDLHAVCKNKVTNFEPVEIGDFILSNHFIHPPCHILPFSKYLEQFRRDKKPKEG